MNKLFTFIVLLLTLGLAEANNHTKADLYKRYPQLKGDSCSQKMNEMLTDIYSDNYQKMWMASVKMITDIGLAPACNNITDTDGNRIAHFVAMQNNVTHLRGLARQGYCLPIECNQESMTYFGDKYFGYMNAQLATLPGLGVHIDTLIFNSDSRVSGIFTVIEEFEDNYYRNTKIGFIVMIVLVSFIVGSSISTNTVWGIIHFIKTQKLDDLIDAEVNDEVQILPETESHKESSHHGFLSSFGKQDEEQFAQVKIHQMTSEEILKPSAKNFSQLSPMYGGPSKILSEELRVQEMGQSEIDQQQNDIDVLNNRLGSLVPSTRQSAAKPLNYTVVSKNSVLSRESILSQHRESLMRQSHENRQSMKNINNTAHGTTADPTCSLAESQLTNTEVEEPGVLKQIFSYSWIGKMMFTRPKERDLMPLSFIKFMLQFSVLITITAYYLNIVTANNPWSMEPQSKSPTFGLVLCGGIVVDTFFTIATILAFFNINQMIEDRPQKTLAITEIFQLYLKRVLRFVPVVYLVFFFGVYVMPNLGGPSEPLWNSFQEILFYRCQEPSIMASKLLFVGNLHPFFQSDLGGCMQWTWCIECDIQLFLLTPWMVKLYRRIGAKKMTYLMIPTFIAGLFIIYFMAMQHELTAGVFSMNNYYQYAFYNKPWNKVSVYALGIMSAMFYIEIKKLREEQGYQNAFANFFVRERTKQNGSKFKHYSMWVIFFLAFVLYYNIAFSARNIQLDPFQWSAHESALWYALTRPGWAVACMILYFLLVCGHSSKVHFMLTNQNLCLIGSLVWPSYLLSPIIYMNMYSRTQEALFMTNIGNCVLGMGGMVLSYLTSILFMYFISYPVETSFSKSVRKNVLGRVYQEVKDKWAN